MINKWCPKCQSYKYREDFANFLRSSDGKQPYCRSCQNGMITEHRQVLRSFRRYRKGIAGVDHKFVEKMEVLVGIKSHERRKQKYNIDPLAFYD